MKKFLLTFLKFISIPFTVIILIEGSMSFLKKDFFSEEKLEKVFKDAANSYKWVSKIENKNKVLLLGSSSTKYGLSCSELNALSKDSVSFISLAMNARDPLETYFILKHADLTNVKSAYFGIDPLIFAKSYYKNRNGYLYLDINFMSAVEYGHEHDKSTFLKRYNSFFRYLFSASRPDKPYVTREEIPADYGTEKLDQEPVNFNKPANEWFQVKEYGWSDFQFTYLMKIVDLCKSRNIALSCYLPPKRSDYSEDYKRSSLSIHKDFVDKLARAGFSVPVYGKYDALDDMGDKELFADIFHLNAKGQKVFSAVFYKMIHEKAENFSPGYSWFNKPGSSK